MAIQPTRPQESHQNGAPFVRGLRLLDATMIVAGSMIGSGIFIAPSLMAGYLLSPGLIVLLWVIGGVLTICGGLSYGELAAAIPKAGGQYEYLREAYGSLWGFLYGWTLFLVIQSGFIAAVAVAFAKYLGVFIPALSENNTLIGVGAYSINSAQVVAMASIVALTIVNVFGVRLGAVIQNIFTLSKLAALGILVALSLLFFNGSFSHFEPLFTLGVPDALQMSFFAACAVAMSKALFAYDAWTSATFTAEETVEPHRTLPRALVLGTAIVTVVYVFMNIAYFYVLPIHQAAAVPDNRIAAEVAGMVMGSGGLVFVTVAILISTIGCNNGLILSGPRVYYAMARDGVFFARVKNIHPVYRTPVVSLFFQCVWACILTLTGTYSDLLTYTTFASLLFNVLTVIALFVFRRTRPAMERPYRVWGYPFVPLLYIAVAVFFIVYIFAGDLRNSGLGLAIILAGVPVYFYWSKKLQRVT